MPFLSEGSSSRARQESPPNSRAIRSPITPRAPLTFAISAYLRSFAVWIPIGDRRVERRLPMPQISEHGTMARRASVSGDLVKSSTPCLSGVFLATRLASFASVLVEAIPTETGRPVHWRTRARISRAKSSPCAASSAKNDSSIEYTSMADTSGRIAAITLADISP